MQERTLPALQTWIKQPKKNYIANEWILGQGAEFALMDPSKETMLCSYRQANAADIDKAISAASAAFQKKAFLKKSMRERATLLRQIGEIARKYRVELATLESLNNGKTYQEAYSDDLPDCADVFDYYAGFIDKIYGETCPVNKNLLNYTLKEPLGVCAQIIPWNFPLLMACWKIAPALATGNTVIIKPSEHTPLSLLYFLEKIDGEVDLPAGTINCVLGDGSVGQVLSSHHEVHKIAFTGSTRVGKQIVESSGLSNLKQVTLELGGKSPVVLFEDMPALKESVLYCYNAMFSHKGEKCSEPSRFLIHKNIFDEVADLLIKRAKDAIVGDPFLSTIEQGAQCHRKHFESVLAYCERGKREGAELLIGGGRDERHERGFFIRPTIFLVDNPALSIAQEEIFGPVLVLQKFDSDEEAIALANNSQYGLAAGLYTKDVDRAHKMAAALDAGMIFINRYGCYEFSSPFGGFKQSGWGKEMGIHSLSAYTKTKSVWLKLSR